MAAVNARRNVNNYGAKGRIIQAMFEAKNSPWGDMAKWQKSLITPLHAEEKGAPARAATAILEYLNRTHGEDLEGADWPVILMKLEAEWIIMNDQFRRLANEFAVSAYTTAERENNTWARKAKDKLNKWLIENDEEWKNKGPRLPKDSYSRGNIVMRSGMTAKTGKRKKTRFWSPEANPPKRPELKSTPSVPALTYSPSSTSSSTSSASRSSSSPSTTSPAALTYSPPPVPALTHTPSSTSMSSSSSSASSEAVMWHPYKQRKKKQKKKKSYTVQEPPSPRHSPPALTGPRSSTPPALMGPASSSPPALTGPGSAPPALTAPASAPPALMGPPPARIDPPHNPIGQLVNLQSVVPVGRQSKANITKKLKRKNAVIERKIEEKVASTGTLPTGSVVELPEQRKKTRSAPEASVTSELPVRPVQGDNPTALPSTAMDTSGSNLTGMLAAPQPLAQAPAAMQLVPHDSAMARPLPASVPKEEKFTSPADYKAMDIDMEGVFGPQVSGDDTQENKTTSALMAMAHLQRLSNEAVETLTGDKAKLTHISDILRKNQEAKGILSALSGLTAPTRSALLSMMTISRDSKFLEGFHPQLQAVARALSDSSYSSESIVHVLGEDYPVERPLVPLRPGERLNIEEEIPEYKNILGRFAEPPTPLHPAQEQRWYEGQERELIQRMDAQRSGSLIGDMASLALTTGSTILKALEVFAVMQVALKVGVPLMGAITPFGWGALAFAAGSSLLQFKSVLDNWGKSKPPVFGPRSSAPTGTRIPETNKYPTASSGDRPQAAGGEATPDIPRPPDPDRGIVAPFTEGDMVRTAPIGVAPPQSYRQRLGTEALLNDLRRYRHIADGILGAGATEEMARRIAKNYDLNPQTVFEWMKKQTVSKISQGLGFGEEKARGGSAPSSAALPPIDDRDDIEMNTQADDAGESSLTSMEAQRRQPAIAQQPAQPAIAQQGVSGGVAGNKPGQAQTPAPPPREGKIRVDDSSVGPSQGSISGGMIPQGVPRRSSVVFVDEKGRPYTVKPGSGTRDIDFSSEYGTPSSSASHLGAGNTKIEYMDLKSIKVDKDTYFVMPDGMLAQGVKREPKDVAIATKQAGIVAERDGSYNIDKLDRAKTRIRLNPDEKKELTIGYDNVKNQQQAVKQGGQVAPVAVKQGGIKSGIRGQAGDGKDQKDQKGQPQQQAGGPNAPDDTQPPLAAPMGGEVKKSFRAEYPSKQEREEKATKDQEDYIPPELRGIVKRLTTPQPQPTETGDQTLGRKGQTGLLRPEFIEGGANFVGEVNKDVTLNLIQELGWQGFNNYQWESNEQGDNPLYIQELTQTGERFSGILFGDEYLPEQEEEASYAIRHIDPKINAFRDVPEAIQQQGRNIFMSVTPYEGQAAISDSNQTQFKPSFLTNAEFHNAFVPDGMHFPSSGPLEKFTEADGTQYPDSHRLLGYEFATHDSEPLSNVNNWIATTTS